MNRRNFLSFLAGVPILGKYLRPNPRLTTRHYRYDLDARPGERLSVIDNATWKRLMVERPPRTHLIGASSRFGAPLPRITEESAPYLIRRSERIVNEVEASLIHKPY